MSAYSTLGSIHNLNGKFTQPRKMVNKSDNIDESLVACVVVSSCKKCGVVEFTDLFALLNVSIALLSGLLLALSLLQQSLWHKDLVLGRDSSASWSVWSDVHEFIAESELQLWRAFSIWYLTNSTK